MNQAPRLDDTAQRLLFKSALLFSELPYVRFVIAGCQWYSADLITATGPESYVAYPSFTIALQSALSYGAADLVWGSPVARWTLDGSSEYVDIPYTPNGVHLGWNWRIGLVGNSNADSGAGSLPSAAQALLQAEGSAALPATFCVS